MQRCFSAPRPVGTAPSEPRGSLLHYVVTSLRHFIFGSGAPTSTAAASPSTPRIHRAAPARRPRRAACHAQIDGARCPLSTVTAVSFGVSFLPEPSGTAQSGPCFTSPGAQLGWGTGGAASQCGLFASPKGKPKCKRPPFARRPFVNPPNGKTTSATAQH